jgi:hypothetical protein
LNAIGGRDAFGAMMTKTIFALLIILIIPTCGGQSSSSGTALIPNYIANGGLPHWQACRAKVLAEAGNCKIMVIGESTPAGGVAFFGADVADQRAGAWPSQLSTVLRQFYNLNARSNSIAGDSGLGAAMYATDDTRVTLNDWTVFESGACIGTFSVGSCPWQTTKSDANFVFQPGDTGTFPSNFPVVTDTLEIWSLAIGGYSGTITVNVNGGSTLATISTGASNAFQHTIVTTGAAPADNAWNIVCSTPNRRGCLFQVLLARNSTVSEVSIINAGWAGATVGDWTARTGNPQDPLLAIEAIAPDLCIIQDDGNDILHGTNLEVFLSNKEAIVSACQMSGDALILTSQPQSQATNTYDVQQKYISADYAAATAKNVPILDWFKMMCGTVSGTGGSAIASKDCWQAGMGSAWNGAWNGARADPVHQSVSAYSVLAVLLAQILML